MRFNQLLARRSTLVPAGAVLAAMMVLSVTPVGAAEGSGYGAGTYSIDSGPVELSGWPSSSTPVIPKYVAFGDSLTTGFSIPRCVEDRESSPWGCDSANPPARPYPNRIADARGYTYSDDPDHYDDPAFFPTPGYPDVTLDRVGIWGDRIDEAALSYGNNMNEKGPWKAQLRAVELATELVTGALGINDFRLTGDLKQWAALYFQDYHFGETRVKERAYDIIDRRDAAFDQMFASLREARDNGATVVVTLYYYFYHDGFDCDVTHDVTKTVVDILNQELKTRAEGFNLKVADFRPAFEGHGAGVGNGEEYTFGTDCSTTKAVAHETIPSWMPFIGGAGQEAIKRGYDPHPNAKGTKAMAYVILGVLP